MCIVCIDLIKLNLTLDEAQKNSKELGLTEKDREKATHYQDIHDALYYLDLNKIGKFLDEAEKK